jgi:lipopolysaccharide export LptBFGC system permease protein LptF
MKKEQKLALIVAALMCASISMFSVSLSTGYGKDKLPIYLGVIAAVLIFWFTGIMLIRKNHRH